MCPRAVPGAGAQGDLVGVRFPASFLHDLQPTFLVRNGQHQPSRMALVLGGTATGHEELAVADRHDAERAIELEPLDHFQRGVGLQQYRRRRRCRVGLWPSVAPEPPVAVSKCRGLDAQVRVASGEGVLLHELEIAAVFVDEILDYGIGQAPDDQELPIVEGDAAWTTSLGKF